MKKIIIFILSLSLFTISLYGQKKDTLAIANNIKLYDLHMEKHKRQIKTGKALAITGSILFVGGYTIALVSLDNGTVDTILGSSFIASCGFIALIASIPVFISARSNLNKAKLMLKAEHIKNENMLFGKSTYPALSLTIKL